MPGQRSFARERFREGVDLDAVFDLVAPKIRHACVEASRQLAEARLGHALIGGLAVGAHGRPRTTDDVDFLVDDAAFVRHAGGLVTLHPAVPIALGGVEIDVLGALEGEDFLREALARAVTSAGVPVLPVQAVVYLKLRANRPQDRADVVALVAAGLDVKAVRAWLGRHAAKLVPRFDKLAREAGP